MTRHELTDPSSGDVYFASVEGGASCPDRAALQAFRRRGWRLRWLRTRTPEARRLAPFLLRARDLRRLLELQALRELNASASTPRPHSMRASGLRKPPPEPDL